jgi:hypothetical protein
MYAQEHHRGAQLSGAGLLLLGFGYIGVGTAKYIYYILRFREVMELSWWSVIGSSSHAAAALIIWLTATASFLVRSIFFLFSATSFFVLMGSIFFNL